MVIKEKAVHCIYKSLQEACRSTRQQWESVREDKKLHILPYNRFKPEQSRIWWLSPSSANPAYKHGKFAFLSGENHTMEVGLYVEKGLGKEYCSIDNTKSARTMILDRDWIWHDVMRDMADGRIGESLGEVSRRSKTAVVVSIEGGYATPVFDPEGPRFQWDRFVFRMSDAGDTLTLVEANHPGNVLEGLERCDTLSTLASELLKVTPNGFLWIDLWFAVRLQLGTNGHDAWNGGRIAWNVLYPLEQWVK